MSVTACYIVAAFFGGMIAGGWLVKGLFWVIVRISRRVGGECPTCGREIRRGRDDVTTSTPCPNCGHHMIRPLELSDHWRCFECGNAEPVGSENLPLESLMTTMVKLREAGGKAWDDVADPIAELDIIRGRKLPTPPKEAE